MTIILQCLYWVRDRTRDRASAGALRPVAVLPGIAGRRPLRAAVRRAAGAARCVPARLRDPQQPGQRGRPDPAATGGRGRDPPQQHGGPDRRDGGGGLGPTAPQPARQAGDRRGPVPPRSCPVLPHPQTDPPPGRPHPPAPPPPPDTPTLTSTPTDH